MQSIENKVLSRIHGRGRGSVWTPADFTDIGERSAIAQALSRHVKAGRIKSIARGLYSYPEQHPVLGDIVPSIDTIAKALKGRDQVRLLPSGAYAANLLHLSEQVPARVVFLSDGPNRKVAVGKLAIELKHVTPKRVAAADRKSGLVIEALRYLGEENISEDKLERITQSLNAKERKQLMDDLRLAPAWMRPHLRNIAAKEGGAT